MEYRRKKIITVFGPNGVGKTSIALKIALELAKRKNNVVTIFADRYVSALPLVTANSEKDTSIRNLLDINIKNKERLTDEDIIKCIHFSKKNKYLGFLGYLPGENAAKFADVSMEVAKSFIDRIFSMKSVDYLIVDCNSDIFTSYLSYAAIQKSDIQYFVCTPDYKSVDYMNSVVNKIKDVCMNWNENLILNQVEKTDAANAMKVRLGSFHYELPKCASLHDQFLEAELLESLPLLGPKVNREAELIFRKIGTAIDYKEEIVPENKIIIERESEEMEGAINAA